MPNKLSPPPDTLPAEPAFQNPRVKASLVQHIQDISSASRQDTNHVPVSTVSFPEASERLDEGISTAHAWVSSSSSPQCAVGVGSLKDQEDESGERFHDTPARLVAEEKPAHVGEQASHRELLTNKSPNASKHYRAENRDRILQNQDIRRCQGLHGKDLEKPRLKARGMIKNTHQKQAPGQAWMGLGESLVTEQRKSR